MTMRLVRDRNTPRSVQRFERAILIGIRSANFIKASGYMRRANRPDIWLHPIRNRHTSENTLARGGHPHMDTTVLPGSG